MIGLISYLVFFATVASILTIAVLGLNLQWGNTGLFNGGVAAFFGAGAYGLILLGGTEQADHIGGFELFYPVALVGGILLSGLIAWVVGILTIRLRRDYLAIATFGVAVAFENLMRNAEWLSGGAKGMRGFERPFEDSIVIGPGGKMIKSIVERTGVKINISDDGLVSIASGDHKAVDAALEIVRDLTRTVEIGTVYDGIVKRVVDFGAFVEVFPGTEGLVHISNLAEGRVRAVTDVVREGDTVKVKAMGLDKRGKLQLSIKDV
jgi:branched-subunit amino acid ABC-type transport system permease component